MMVHGARPARAGRLYAAADMEGAATDRLSRLRRIWAAPLWAHAAALAVLLLALLPVMGPESTFTGDEGAYALQVRALEQGSWQYRYKAAAVDPDGRWFPVVLSNRNGNRFYPYVQHPAYPLLMRVATAVAGTSLGLHLVALLGAVGAAAAAWLLAAEVDATLGRPAFWVTASSPVLVNGTLLWAHAPSAAAAGLALVAATRLARRPHAPLATAGAVVALAGGVLLRSEGLLFAGALVVVVAARRLRPAGARAALSTLAVLGVPVAAAALGERAWVRAIVGRTVDTLTVREGATRSTPYLAGRLAGAFHSLFQAHYESVAAGPPVLAALGLAVGLGCLALRRWGPSSRRDLAIAVTGVVVLYGLRVAQHPTDGVTGLFAAWPVAALGLVLLRGRDRHPTVDLCLVVGAVFSAGVLLTQYPEGGGLEWGGRFLSPATVPLAVVATVALARRIRGAPAVVRPLATVAVGGLAVASTLFGLVTVARARAGQDGFIAAAARHPATVTVTTLEAYPRIAWRTHDRLSWMLTDDAGLPVLLATLRAAGVADVAVVTRRGVPAADLAAYREVRPLDEPALDRVGASMLLLEAGR